MHEGKYSLQKLKPALRCFGDVHCFQLGLNVHIGHKINQLDGVGDDVKEMLDLHRQSSVVSLTASWNLRSVSIAPRAKGSMHVHSRGLLKRLVILYSRLLCTAVT